MLLGNRAVIHLLAMLSVNAQMGNKLVHIPNLPGKTFKNSYIIVCVVTFTGGLCTMILAILWSVVVLKRHLEDRVKLSYTYSYNHYGFWWGVTILVFITLPLMLYSDLSMMIESYNEYTSPPTYLYDIPAGMLLLCILSGVPIAIYFVYKTKQPPAIPYILIIPVTVLFCCCNTKRAKLLVFGMALWINLVALPLTALHGVVILVTVIAEPFAVITNTLVLVLTLFCLANIICPIIYNFCLYLHSKTSETTRRRDHHATCYHTHPLASRGWLHQHRNWCYGLFGQCGHKTRKFCINGQFCLCSTRSRISYIWS